MDKKNELKIWNQLKDNFHYTQNNNYVFSNVLNIIMIY